MNWNVERLTEILNELFVAIALLATQMEVAMSSLNMIAQIAKDAQQSHAISPTTKCHNVKTVMGQKLMLRDEIGYFILHFSLFTSHST